MDPVQAMRLMIVDHEGDVVFCSPDEVTFYTHPTCDQVFVRCSWGDGEDGYSEMACFPSERAWEAEELRDALALTYARDLIEGSVLCVLSECDDKNTQFKYKLFHRGETQPNLNSLFNFSCWRCGCEYGSTSSVARCPECEAAGSIPKVPEQQTMTGDGEGIAFEPGDIAIDIEPKDLELKAKVDSIRSFLDVWTGPQHAPLPCAVCGGKGCIVCQGRSLS